ncbi:Pr6Pr family membrane protein [soil metagenome]
MRILFAVLRVAVAAATVAAVVAQLDQSISNWVAAGVTNLPLSILNFFSFFTIESNVLAMVFCLIGAFLLVARRGTPDPAWFNGLRAGATTYMVVTGIVYNLLLRGIELPQGTTVPWSNEVLHVVVPVWMLLDWLLVPGRAQLAWKSIVGVIVFPIVWVVYTLVRGPFTPDELHGRSYWYPYPFLNPNLSQNGYLSVSFYVILIAVVIGLTAAGVVWVSRRRALRAG